MRPLGRFFCIQKVARDNRTRLNRKNTLDNGEEDFYVSPAAVCRHWQDWNGRLPLRKILFHRSHGSGIGSNGNRWKREEYG